MVPATAQPPSSATGAHLVLYDGVCGLCNRVTQFLLRHDHRRVFVYASLQSRVGRGVVEKFGGDPELLTSFYVIADYQTDAAQFFARSDAVLFVASRLGWPWRATLAVRLLPKGIRDLGYGLIARVRYRVFGRHDHCPIPAPEDRSRFID